MSDKIVIAEMEEEKAEQKVEAKAEPSVHTFEPSKIGGLFFTEKGLTIFPKNYMEKFQVGQNVGLIGKESSYDYSQVAGALDRVVTLEKENNDLKGKIAKLEAQVKEDEKEKPVKAETMPPIPLTDEEKKKLEEEKKAADQKKMEMDKEKESAKAKSVEAQKEEKSQADHSDTDDDIRRLMGGLKKSREAGKL